MTFDCTQDDIDKYIKSVPHFSLLHTTRRVWLASYAQDFAVHGNGSVGRNWTRNTCIHDRWFTLTSHSQLKHLHLQMLSREEWRRSLSDPETSWGWFLPFLGKPKWHSRRRQAIEIHLISSQCEGKRRFHESGWSHQSIVVALDSHFVMNGDFLADFGESPLISFFQRSNFDAHDAKLNVSFWHMASALRRMMTLGSCFSLTCVTEEKRFIRTNSPVGNFAVNDSLELALFRKIFSEGERGAN